MSFNAEQRRQLAPLWERMLAHPFLVETCAGSVADAKFARWMRQDYLFVERGVHFRAALPARAPRRHHDALAKSVDALRRASWRGRFGNCKALCDSSWLRV
jgi:thiaminase